MTRFPRLRLSLSLLAILTLGLFALSPTLIAAADSGPAPAWSLKDVNGKTVKSSDFKGKVVILDFWATWCPPCVAEIPHFITLQDKYSKKGVTFIGASVDEDGAKSVVPFMERAKINYPIVLSTEDVADKYGASEAIPTTIVIDRKGNIVSRTVGSMDPAALEKEIQSLL